MRRLCHSEEEVSDEWFDGGKGGGEGKLQGPQIAVGICFSIGATCQGNPFSSSVFMLMDNSDRIPSLIHTGLANTGYGLALT
jgi:hypothetical protein